MTFEIVTRPSSGRSSGHIDEKTMAALIETGTNGQALKLDASGIHLINWQSTVRNRLRKINPNLTLRYRHDKVTETLTVWVEVAKKPEAFSEPSAQ